MGPPGFPRHGVAGRGSLVRGALQAARRLATRDGGVGAPRGAQCRMTARYAGVADRHVSRRFRGCPAGSAYMVRPLRWPGLPRGLGVTECVHRGSLARGAPHAAWCLPALAGRARGQARPSSRPRSCVDGTLLPVPLVQLPVGIILATQGSRHVRRHARSTSVHAAPRRAPRRAEMTVRMATWTETEIKISSPH